MLFGHKDKDQMEVQIDLGDLDSERENLSNFLQSNLKVTVSTAKNKLKVHQEKLSVQELQRAVTKFVYHRHLNNTHWVSIDEKTVKINRFKTNAQKKEKRKKDSLHQTPIQSWGL